MSRSHGLPGTNKAELGKSCRNIEEFLLMRTKLLTLRRDGVQWDDMWRRVADAAPAPAIQDTPAPAAQKHMSWPTASDWDESHALPER